jgi:nucleoside-diphosphate-sugar epimerase
MTKARPVVLVTGASGFVGGHLAPVLARDGWNVRRAVRKPTGSGEEVLIESIGPTTDWRAALAGVEAVVHLAARVHRPGEENAAEIYRDINAEGTLQLARCAAAAGVRRFVYVSTILVNGSRTDGRAPFREDDTFAPRGVYGMSKAAAESGLKELARDTGMYVTVVRPPLIYGAGARGNFRLLVRAVKLGVPLPFASIHNRRAFLGVQNLASFIANRLSGASLNFDTFLLADDEQVSTPEFIRRIAKAADTTVRLVPMPEPALRLLLKMSGRPEARDSLIGSMEIDVSKAASTGWRPPLSLDEGLRLALSSPRPV